MLELVEDLGSICPTSKSTYKRRMGIFRCGCGNVFRADYSAVSIGRITKCGLCKVPYIPSISTEEAVTRLKQVHSGTYDYSKVVYSTRTAKIKIICPIHGEFTQSYCNHLVGSGCPICANTARVQHLQEYTYYKQECTLYFVFFKKLGVYKLGVTTQKVNTRFNGEVEKPDILWSKRFSTVDEGTKLEREILDKFKDYAYVGQRLLKRKGNTELLTIDITDYLISSVETKETVEIQGVL